jgi:ferredoxin-NADP reductase
MAGIHWQLATVADIRQETPRVRSFTLALPDWGGHLPGQHVDIRLTAEDGYQAQRSYSIASAPHSDPARAAQIELGVERVDDGEVSPFMHDVMVSGDRLEVRGPIGGYFVWDGMAPEPVLLVAGGSGIVPLMAMIRHRSAIGARAPVTLVYSSRTRDDVIYYHELERLATTADGPHVIHTLTRAQPPGWTGLDRRIDRPMLEGALEGNAGSTQAFVCGPTPLVESAAEALVGLGLAPSQVRTERFGPSGG